MSDTKMHVDAWNERHQMGCRVMYRRDDGTARFTKTRSRAAVLSTHQTPVIWLENVIGCVALDRVTPIHFSQAAAIEQADVETNSRRANPG